MPGLKLSKKYYWNVNQPKIDVFRCFDNLLLSTEVKVVNKVICRVRIEEMLKENDKAVKKYY